MCSVPHLFLSVTALVTLSGCSIATSEHPLSPPTKAAIDKRIAGVWRLTDGPDNTVTYVHVGKAGDDFPDGVMRLLIVSQPTDNETPMQFHETLGFLTKTKDSVFLNWTAPKETDGASEETHGARRQWNPEKMEPYVILKVHFQGKEVLISKMNEEFVERAIREKRVGGAVTERGLGKDVSLSASTQNLFKFVSLNAGRLFEKPAWRFVRVK